MQIPLWRKFALGSLLFLGIVMMVAGAMLRYTYGSAGAGPGLLRISTLILAGCGGLIMYWFKEWIHATVRERHKTHFDRAKGYVFWIGVAILLVGFFNMPRQGLSEHSLRVWTFTADVMPLILVAILLGYFALRQRFEKDHQPRRRDG